MTVANSHVRQRLREAAQKKRTKQGSAAGDKDTVNMGRLRRKVRGFLEPYVEGGVDFVVKVQSYRTPFMDTVFAFVSWFGTHQFYLTLLPVLFWCGFSRSARHLTMLMSIGIYLGNCFKDFTCLPRPQSPPVARVLSLGSHEYGMPSTHSVNAATFPLFLFLDYFHLNPVASLHPPSTAFYVACLALALLVTTSICFSRIYLGMHCLADVLVGLGLGLTILAVWIAIPGPLFEQWILHGEHVPFWAVVVGIALILFHPVAIHPCPCFEDSVCFIGAAIGVVSGVWGLKRLSHRFAVGIAGEILYPFERLGTSGSLVRIAVGLCCILISRAVVKFVAKGLCPLFFSHNSPHLCCLKAIEPISPQSPAQIAGLHVSTSHSALNPSGADTEERTSSIWDILDVDTVVRLMAYSAVGSMAVMGSPIVFHLLELA